MTWNWLAGLFFWVAHQNKPCRAPAAVLLYLSFQEQKGPVTPAFKTVKFQFQSSSGLLWSVQSLFLPWVKHGWIFGGADIAYSIRIQIEGASLANLLCCTINFYLTAVCLSVSCSTKDHVSVSFSGAKPLSCINCVSLMPHYDSTNDLAVCNLASFFFFPRVGAKLDEPAKYVCDFIWFKA